MVKTEVTFNQTCYICECVRSIINFHPRNQDVDFDMLEMFFSFQCTINDENRWLNKEKFLKGDKTSMLHYCDAQCTVVLYRDWLLQMGQMGPKMTLGTMKMSGDDFPGV